MLNTIKLYIYKLTANAKYSGGSNTFRFRLNHLQESSGTSKNQRHWSIVSYVYSLCAAGETLKVASSFMHFLAVLSHLYVSANKHVIPIISLLVKRSVCHCCSSLNLYLYTLLTAFFQVVDCFTDYIRTKRFL
jgi:hypothetical protein